jgi:hypothetical protein
MPNQYICEQCGNSFRGWRGNPNRFCSRQCAHLSWGRGRPVIPQPDGSALVPLRDGRYARVSDEDAERVASLRWHGAQGRYAGSGSHKSGTFMSMHRFILDCPPGSEPDHINGDPLDNRRENLRCASRAENTMNRGLSKANTSGFRGVYPSKGRWCAKIKKHHLGYFLSKEEAARAYDLAARAMFGDFAQLNFPDD